VQIANEVEVMAGRFLISIILGALTSRPQLQERRLDGFAQAEREDATKTVAGGSTKRNRRNPQIVAAKSAKSRDEALPISAMSRSRQRPSTHNFDPEPGFPKTHEAIAAIKAAIVAARPGKVVFLSTVGAQVAEFNLLNNAKITEEGLRTVHVPVAFLRRPRRYSANDVAAGFAEAVCHPVRMKAVPRDTWEALFRSQGMKHPLPRIRMLDGFNDGWIDFEGNGGEHRIGRIPLESVLKGLAAQA
jgi:hypothetical protein